MGRRHSPSARFGRFCNSWEHASTVNLLDGSTWGIPPAAPWGTLWGNSLVEPHGESHCGNPLREMPKGVPHCGSPWGLPKGNPQKVCRTGNLQKCILRGNPHGESQGEFNCQEDSSLGISMGLRHDESPWRVGHGGSSSAIPAWSLEPEGVR